MRIRLLLAATMLASCTPDTNGTATGGNGGGSGGSADGAVSQNGDLDMASPGGNPISDMSGNNGGDMASNPGAPITCSAPGSYNHNGGSCGTERWSVKTGTDADVSKVSLVPKPTTIATLIAIPRPSNPPANGRVVPTETTVWRLTNVKVSVVKSESDSDYHLVVSDGSATMIVEVPYPGCVNTSSPFGCFVTHARGVADSVTSGSTVTVEGVGFFDFNHGQTGEAPNSIELHPVLGLCVGQNCTPN